MMREPLVSVLVYNYNYGKYLDQCISSILNQTYENIELLFSDNASTDNSWEIALKWQNKYPGKMFVARNRMNFGTDANLKNCAVNRRGEYHIVIGSDDYIEKNLIEKCVKVMEVHKDAAFCIFNRNVVDEKGDLKDELPFYNKSCKIFPPGQSLVYTVAAVNPTISQILYRSVLTESSKVEDTSYGAQHYSTRILDFDLSLKYPIIYLTDALVNHRIHGENQSLVATKSMQEIIGQFQLSYSFLYKLKLSNFSAERISEYENKVSDQYSLLSMRYFKREFLKGNMQDSLQYLFLCGAFDNKKKHFNEIINYMNIINNKNFDLLANELSLNNNYQRVISYDPPDPFSILYTFN